MHAGDALGDEDASGSDEGDEGEEGGSGSGSDDDADGGPSGSGDESGSGEGDDAGDVDGLLAGKSRLERRRLERAAGAHPLQQGFRCGPARSRAGAEDAGMGCGLAG